MQRILEKRLHLFQRQMQLAKLAKTFCFDKKTKLFARLSVFLNTFAPIWILDRTLCSAKEKGQIFADAKI
ncbi:MAG: hypothetical protein HY220_00720 [Candidatus Sungbacteria bacterium]|uniref:Uncharacterized protein n=1 Tax=Candidatus Sungiibacteriota bacterium TaxID=2750080 RepID=A0A9D6QTK7_9BACT|nr:hypothetical protein [Candidatus Sungbacteria bacterium]